MGRINHFLLFLCFLTLPLSGYSQSDKSKGLSGNQLRVITTITQERSLHDTLKRTCHALAIGVTGPFVDESLSSLSFPDDDCQAFFQALNRLFRYQYNIKQFSFQGVENSKRTYYQACVLLDNLKAQNISEGDIVLMYFSGHGISFRNNYYFPLCDANVSRHSSMITGGMIIEIAENLANKGANVLVFLDTCASGSILKEPIYLGDKGGVICYPATSKNNTTQERLSLGGSEFGNRLMRLLSGEDYERTENDELTVDALSRSLSMSMTGGVTPVAYNSHSSDIAKLTLVNNVSAIKSYNTVLDQYHHYINNGNNAISLGQYDVAITSFENANKLALEQRLIFSEDIIDTSPQVERIKEGILNMLKEDPSSDVWKVLVNIDESNSLLDGCVNYAELYLGCGRYYKGKGEYENAFVFFDKALKKGDKKEAPYEIYLLTQNQSIPKNSPIEDPERAILLQMAADNGNASAYEILHPKSTKVFSIPKEPKQNDSQQAEVKSTLKYVIKSGVLIVDWSQMVFTFPISVGLYDLWGPILMELSFNYGPYRDNSTYYSSYSNYSMFSGKAICGGDLFIGSRIMKALYLRVGPGFFICSNMGYQTKGLCFGTGLSVLFKNHFCLDLGLKYYPQVQGQQKETISTSSGNGYSFPNTVTMINSGVSLSIGIGGYF